MEEVFRWLAAGLVGFVVGLLGGTIGLVLGVLRLPVVALLIPNPAQAAGTNIGASAVGALGGSWAHFRAARINRRVLISLGIPSIIGAFIGGYFGGMAPDRLLLGLIALVVGASGLDILRQVPWQAGHDRPGSVVSGETVGPAHRAKEIAIGLGIGLLGGTVGLILGSLRLPAMLRVLGIQPQEAIGTNLAVGFALGVVGFAAHALRGQVDYLTWLFLAAASLPGAYLGGQLTGRISADTLRLWIGVVLLLLAAVNASQAIFGWSA